MIRGVGVDVVDVERFGRVIERTPGVLTRTLTDAEVQMPDGRKRPIESLAARFAAKEAAAKALGCPRAWDWHSCEVMNDARGQPHLRVSGDLARIAEERGVAGWHLSLSHDGGIAIAVVIADGA